VMPLFCAGSHLRSEIPGPFIGNLLRTLLFLNEDIYDDVLCPFSTYMIADGSEKNSLGKGIYIC
jgi:hypothetical protein